MRQIHIVEQVNGASPQDRRIRPLVAFDDAAEARAHVRRLRARFRAAADRSDELAAFFARHCNEHPYPDEPGRPRKAWDRAYEKARTAFLRSIGVEDQDLADAIAEYDEWDPPSFRVTPVPLCSAEMAGVRRRSAADARRTASAAGAARPHPAPHLPARIPA